MMYRNQLSMVSLASGSQGNCYYIWNDENGVLIDCGISTKQIMARLKQLGFHRPRIDAVFITHEHVDHIASCAVLSRYLAKNGQNPKFYMSSGTYHAASVACIPPNVLQIAEGMEITVGSLNVEAFTVPHDGIGTMGYRVGFGGHWAGVITDLGYVNDTILDKLRSFSMMAFEFNHDVDMLMKNDNYPLHVKERIRSDYGHLSNIQAANALHQAVSPRLQHLILAHISEQNNIPDLAHYLAEDALNRTRHLDIVSLHVAQQNEPSPIFTVDKPPQICLSSAFLGL